MGVSFDIWKLLFGVALFLLGMSFIEASLQMLAGRRFKLFLKKQTSQKVKAIGGGALVTAVLQSSSLVNLMVLAFVGAGVLTMNNALAVILGANLGTTLSSWIVALLGFKMNIESVAIPVAGVAGLGFALFNKQSRLFNWSRFLLGMSFLFVGLGYLKTGIEDLVLHVDLSQFERSPLMVFFLVGFLITSAIQSSSATMALTLSALFAGAIPLTGAMAIALGSEIGTTIKLFMASIGGIAAKKRVAAGNFIFNVLVSALMLIFLFPVHSLITEQIGIRDSLIALVFFQTFVNIVCIILFYPFLNVLGKYLGSWYRKNEDETMYIQKADPREPSTALDALEEECRHFLVSIRQYALSCFDLPDHETATLGLSKKFSEHNMDEKYLHIKFVYGEIHSYYIQLQKQVNDKYSTEKLDRLMSAARNGMYAAKSFKDSIPDKTQLANSSNDTKFSFFQKTRAEVNDYCDGITALLKPDSADIEKNLFAVYQTVTAGYTGTLQQLYKEGTAGHVNETEITTMLNFNREIITAFKSMVFAIKDLRLDREQSRHLDEMPGFIR